MSFTKILVSHLKLEYEGLLSVADLYQVIDLWFREKSFDKKDILDINVTKPDGSKHIELEIEPWRRWNDYYKQKFQLRIFITDCKNVQIEKDGKTQTMQHAKVTIAFDLLFDYDAFGKSKEPLPNFIQVLWDKIFMKAVSDKYESLAVEDMNHLYQTIKKHLNMTNSGELLPRYEDKT